MPHLVIIDRNGNVVSGGHRSDGDTATYQTTIKDLIKDDHAPSGIILPEPPLELAQILFKEMDKFYKDRDKD